MMTRATIVTLLLFTLLNMMAAPAGAAQNVVTIANDDQITMWINFECYTNNPWDTDKCGYENMSPQIKCGSNKQWKFSGVSNNKYQKINIPYGRYDRSCEIRTKKIDAKFSTGQLELLFIRIRCTGQMNFIVESVNSTKINRPLPVSVPSHVDQTQSSRLKQSHDLCFSPLTEPCVRTSYTAPVHLYPRLIGGSTPVLTAFIAKSPSSSNHALGNAMWQSWHDPLRKQLILMLLNSPLNPSCLSLQWSLRVFPQFQLDGSQPSPYPAHDLPKSPHAVRYHEILGKPAKHRIQVRDNLFQIYWNVASGDTFDF